MTTDFRALCAELTDCLEKADWPLRHRYVFRQWIDIARAALAGEPAVPEVVGSEWQPCVKLPITVHVREQRPGEQHVLTREGITPVQPDDLIMLGVDGEEYPIGRELFQRTYRMGSADEPAVPECREPAAVTGQPSDGEVAELVAWLREQLHVCLQAPWTPGIKHFGRAAELLQRLSPPQPVPVSERPWEREGWCDTGGLCWLGSGALDGCTPTWLYVSPAWAERFPDIHRVLLPAHALPLPEVGD